MFKNPIELTPPFTSELINECAVKRSDLNGDKTLFMTLIALLYNRVKNLKLISTISRGLSIDQVPFNFDPNIYSLHWVETGVNPDDSLKDITGYEEVVSLTNIEMYLKNKFNQVLYIRKFPKENCVAFFTPRITMEMWHLLQSFTSKYFEIFEEKPLTTEEIAFAQSLIFRTPNEYLQKLGELANSEDFKLFTVTSQIDRFEKKIYERKIRNAKTQVGDLENQMESVLNDYRRLVQRHFDAKMMLEGLTATNSGIEEKTELQEYLINNKSLANIIIEDSHIKFVVKTFLIPYLTEDWENASARGAIFGYFNPPSEFSNVSDVKLLLDAILSSNHCLKLKICGHVDLNYLGNDVSSYTGYDYSPFVDYVPNTHLSKHSCFGQNKPDILAQVQMGDTIGAIECAINCVKHVNVNEIGASFTPFVDGLLRCKGKCLVAEDGQELTPVEALNYLKERNNENNPVG